MIKEAIRRVVAGEHLSESDMEKTIEEILLGGAKPSQIGSFLTALRMKGETVEEITGAARALRARVLRFQLNNHMVNLDRDDINVEEETVLDTCDMGESGTKTFNVSTATALVVAGGGIRVCKHGNRANSRYLGTADVLENLGVNLDISSYEAERCLHEVGIAFLFAPLYTGPMKHVAGPRQEMGIRTIFNLIGPLANPANAHAHILGVYEPALTDKMAKVLNNLEAREAFVVCGEGTFDEISICGPTKISHLKDGKVSAYVMEPEEYGFKRAERKALFGGSARENARIIRSLLDGETGPKRDVVLLNAGAAFVAAGLDAVLAHGIKRAAEVIDSGRAREKLGELVEFTNQSAPFVRGEFHAHHT